MTKNKFYKILAEYEDYHTYKGSVGRPLKKITREDLWNYVSQPLGAEVKPAACGKWQRKKPDKPCYFLHRYNKKDNHPSLFDAYTDYGVLCVANIQDDEFVETMEGFADGQFFIIEK